MSNLAIKVENLSKQYKIGTARYRHDSIRDHLADWAKSLFVRNGHSTAAGGQPSPVNGPRSSVDGRSDTFWALKDVSFEVQQGEVIGIIGRNGAGKSTLLKILSRIVEPTRGFADIHGRVGSLLEVGTGFHRDLTGRENIYLNGAILGMKKAEIERKFDEIVDFSGIEKFIDTPVKRYSSGMYTRLAFAVAAHLDPEVLIVDEVLAVGDAAFQRKCMGKMGDVAREGRTVLFVSHNMAAIKTLCSRCLLVESGEILADGPADIVVNRYIDLYNQALRAKRPKSIKADTGKEFVLHRKEDNGEITICCGDPLVLEFEIEAPQPISETNAGIGITLLSPTDDPLVSMSSNVQALQKVPGLSRHWRVRCDMGRLPLNAGVYFARVIVGDSDQGRTIFRHAMTIEVIAHDVFGWGRCLPSPTYWGPVYWAPDWEIRPGDERT